MKLKSWKLVGNGGFGIYWNSEEPYLEIVIMSRNFYITWSKK